MSFLTELCQDHHQIVLMEIVKCLDLPEVSITTPPFIAPVDRFNMVQVEGFWLPTGELDPFTDDKYVVTPSVKKNLHNLVRVVSARYIWAYFTESICTSLITESTQYFCKVQLQLERLV